jgi:hypothetical protein
LQDGFCDFLDSKMRCAPIVTADIDALAANSMLLAHSIEC